MQMAQTETVDERAIMRNVKETVTSKTIAGCFAFASLPVFSVITNAPPFADVCTLSMPFGDVGLRSCPLDPPRQKNEKCAVQ